MTAERIAALLARNDQELDRVCAAYRTLAVPGRRRRKPRAAVAGGLRTPQQAARYLGISVKTLREHVAAGELRYISIGKGTKRTARRFADSDLDEFATAQSRKDSPCRSIASRTRGSSISNSGSSVVAFTAAPKPRPGAKPKK